MEVVQLYLGLPGTAEVVQAPRKLSGFARVELKPGETKHISIPVEARSLSYWDVKERDGNGLAAIQKLW